MTNEFSWATFSRNLVWNHGCVAFLFALYFFTEESVSILFGSMVLVSLTAMLWNLIFNYFLDKVFTGPREKRGVIFRTLHAISFEGGFTYFSPCRSLLTFLKVDWITAFMMDFSLTVMVTVYTFIFNWVYDHARLLFISVKDAIDKRERKKVRFKNLRCFWIAL